MESADKTNILIVDDLPEKVLVLSSILEELGENIVSAQSGREALRHLLDCEFAVILLDINMPDMDGFETATLIRQRKRTAHTPIIFITAFSDEMHAARGYSLGAVDYILSPVVPEVLRTKVRVFVDLFRMREQVKRQADQRVALAQEQAARAAAEEANRRSRFLAEASTVLASSLDPEATLPELARLLVPFLGDLSVITLVDDDANRTDTELAWQSSASGPCAVSVRDYRTLPTPLALTLERVVVSGKMEVLADLDPNLAPVAALENASAETMANEKQPPFAVRSGLVLPLVARDRTLGVLALARAHSSQRYTPADVAFAEDLANRAAVALDNARLYRSIREDDRRKNEFLAMLAHELRNPLAPIRNAVQILHEDGLESSVLQWIRDVIDRQVKHLVRLVDDLLDISRITRGKIRLQKEQLDVRAVASSAAESSRPLIEARQQKLTISLPAEPVHLLADHTRLVQILGNLLNNASKYSEEGGQIYLSVERDGNEGVFRVRDSGIGISAEMLSRVFDLFTQVDRSLDRSQGGLGIGLTLVRRLVEMHQGTVQASSAGPGKGSEFVVRLPLLVNGLPQSISLSNGDVCSLPITGRRRILVVDDNCDGADSLGTLLRMAGHDVRICHNGPASLVEADVFSPEVVMLDIGMAGIDGYEIARQLRRTSHLQNALLIAVTGYGQEEARQRSLQAGFDHHLVKPVDLKVLHELLSRLEENRLPTASAG
jgi:signal transduction histidine kinase/DNA-binding response OmpR family regulator